MPLTHPILIIPDDEDGDSDIEILAYCLGPQDADIELLPTPVTTQEEQDNRLYHDNFRLAHPPRQVLSNREKLNARVADIFIGLALTLATAGN